MMTVPAVIIMPRALLSSTPPKGLGPKISVPPPVKVRAKGEVSVLTYTLPSNSKVSPTGTLMTSETVPWSCTLRAVSPEPPVKERLPLMKVKMLVELLPKTPRGPRALVPLSARLFKLKVAPPETATGLVKVLAPVKARVPGPLMMTEFDAAPEATAQAIVVVPLGIAIVGVLLPATPDKVNVEPPVSA